MSDKTSQRTEEEMLDQTFVGYDEEMTVQTEDGAKDGAVKPAEAPAKKINQNLLIFGAVGVAALGVLGFKFLGGNSTPQQPTEALQPTAQQPQAQVPVANVAPVVAATTEPVQVPVPMPVNVPSPEVAPNASLVTQVSSAPVVDPVAQYTGDTSNTSNVSLPKPEVKPEIKAEVKPEVKPQVKPEVHIDKVAAVVATNAEANFTNEKLLAQFQDMLDRKYDPKFNKIEKALDEQKEFNKTIEERLSRLEAGKSTKVSVKSSVANDSSSSSTTTSSLGSTNAAMSSSETKTVKKIVRKPILIRHKAEANVGKDMKLEDGEVLIDKNYMKTKPDIQKIEPVYPKVEIHSVYSGRIWTKNADGTLSTFAVGDRLPTGEIIKKIDEEKERITTDKRVISE